MKILINDTKLNLLLEQKKQYIGKKVTVDNVLSAASFLISVVLATYEDLFGVPGLVFKVTFVLLGIFFTAKSIYDLVSGRKNNYTYEDLLSDINKLNEIQHNHSIVVIKDTFQKHPNRFMVYDDERWKCKLFMNYKENENNEQFIKEHLSGELKVDVNKINLYFKGARIHQKYSESAKKEKIFSHKFYLAVIDEFPEDTMEDSFEIDGRKYYWKSIPELEQDEVAMKKNSDVIGYVKELF